MKNIVVTLLFLLFAWPHVNAQSLSNQKFIEITGYGVTSVEPDIIYYDISLPNSKINEMTRNNELAKEDSVDVAVDRKINEDNNLKWIKIREILGQQKLSEGTDPDTKSYNIGNKQDVYNFNYTSANTDEEITVKLPNLKKLDDLVTQLKTVKGCKGSIRKIDNSNLIALREETLMKALANAKDKAEKIAAKMNIKLGKVIQINEQPPLNNLISGVSKEMSAIGLSPSNILNKTKNITGKISLSENIVVRFAIDD